MINSLDFYYPNLNLKSKIGKSGRTKKKASKTKSCIEVINLAATSSIKVR